MVVANDKENNQYENSDRWLNSIIYWYAERNACETKKHINLRPKSNQEWGCNRMKNRTSRKEIFISKIQNWHNITWGLLLLQSKIWF
jgi:hypothetical protein